MFHQLNKQIRESPKSKQTCQDEPSFTDLFLRIMEKHGTDKILFATDCPWRDMKADLKIFNSFGINKEDFDKILYKNAEKLLNLR